MNITFQTFHDNMITLPHSGCCETQLVSMLFVRLFHLSVFCLVICHLPDEKGNRKKRKLV